MKLITIIIFSSLSFCSCQTSQKSDSTTGRVTAGARVTAPNFDKILKCDNYSGDENYFLTADEGCLYNPNGANTFGNLVIYLIPKKPLNINDDNNLSETKKVNNLNAAQLKEDFTIYVYAIDKKYLNYNKTGDPIYYQKDIFLLKSCILMILRVKNGVC
ncbi:hypothetical protein [Pedobacter sp. NJ-S-72]